VTESAPLNPVPEVEPEARAPSWSRRRVPWRDLVGLLVSCLIVVLVFSPVVFGGRTLSTAAKTAGTNGFAPFPGQPKADYSSDFRVDQGAQSWQAEPWAEVAHRAYADRELPLWNPYQGAGAPLAANMSSAVFDPLLLAVNLHPTPLTWDLSILGAFLLGAAAAYLFGRVLGLQVVPAVVSSAAFSLSGWFFIYSNNQLSRSYAFLPLLFLLVELTLRSRRWWPVLALGVVVAENIYVGMPEASFFVIGAAAVYAAVRLVQQRSEMPILVSLARLGGGCVLGLLLAAPPLLLFLQYQSLSFNVHKSGSGQGSGADPAWGLLHWVVPWFPGAPAPPRDWFGAAVAISTLAALSGRKETKRLHAWLFLLLGVVLLAKIYDFGVLGWVGRLPVAELVIFPAFAPPVVSFAFAVLAGIGVQVLWNGDLRLRRFLTLLVSALTLLVVFLSADDRLRVIVEGRQTVWARAALFAVLAVAAVAIAALFGRRWAAVLLAGLIVVELLTLAPFSIYARRADPFLAPDWMPLVRTAQASEPDSRVFGIDGKLYPNTASALGLQDIRVLDALQVARYRRYIRTFIQPAVYDRFTGNDERPARFEDNPMFDALGVRAILTARDLANVPALRLLGRNGDTRVYENTNAYPRAWVVHDIQLVDGQDAAFGFLEARAHRKGGVFIVDEFDARHEAVVEGNGTTAGESLGPPQGARDECTGRDRDRATIQGYSGNSVSLRVKTACPGLLVLPDTYFPGWKATVDGRDATINPTDGAFRGVTVPEGISHVVFRYEPRAFPIGVVLAAAGLVGFLGIGLIRWWLTRSRHRGMPSAQLEGAQRY
jgi:hypothetical protein